jgi:hypothetical protein
MDPALHAMLETLPPARRRSKLEPHAALIRALRTRGRSYREIVLILREHCGVSVGVHTVFHFVQRRTRKTIAPRRARRALSPPAPSLGKALTPAPASVDEPTAVWTRIAAMKQRGPAGVTTPKAFIYDETEPLRLTAEITPRKGEKGT